MSAQVSPFQGPTEVRLESLAEHRWWAADANRLRALARGLETAHRRLAELLSDAQLPGEPEPDHRRGEVDRAAAAGPIAPSPQPPAQGELRVTDQQLADPIDTVARQTFDAAAFDLYPGAKTAMGTSEQSFPAARLAPLGLDLPLVLVVAGIVILLAAIGVHLA